MNSNNKIKKSIQAKFKIKTYIFKKPLIKKNIKGLAKMAGRNNFGKITVWHKGGGHKNKYRNIDFQRIELSTGIVCSMEYDPNRNSIIASIFDFFTNDFFYIITPKNLKIGDIIKSGNFSNPRLGHHLKITNIPIGSYIHNIKLKKFKCAKIARAAGTFCQVTEKKLNYTLIKFSSGKCKLVKSNNTYATIGIVSNGFSFLSNLKKAGQSRWLNKRPNVRGVAMNPIDHPNGGGEGKKSGKNRSP